MKKYFYSKVFNKLNKTTEELEEEILDVFNESCVYMTNKDLYEE